MFIAKRERAHVRITSLKIKILLLYNSNISYITIGNIIGGEGERKFVLEGKSMIGARYKVLECLNPMFPPKKR